MYITLHDAAVILQSKVLSKELGFQGMLLLLLNPSVHYSRLVYIMYSISICVYISFGSSDQEKVFYLM